MSQCIKICQSFTFWAIASEIYYLGWHLARSIPGSAEGSYVAAYRGTKPKRGNLAQKSNSQVHLHAQSMGRTEQ